MDIFYFEKSVKKGNSKDLSKLKRKKIWIDISNVTRQQAETLQRKFNLHSVTEEDLVVTHERIKVEQFPNYLFCTFYGIGKKGGKIELVALNYIIGKKFIITTHRGTIDTYERLKRDKEELKDLFNIGIDAIFHRLLDEEIDNFFPVLEEIDDEIERIDEKIAIKTRPEVLSDILNVKKKLIEIKKITFPQREKISSLSKRRYRFLSESSIPYFRDVYDHSIRISDIIDNYRESVSSSFDAYMSSLANYTNDVMKVLSIIATIALPLTVVSGIYGTNFLNLPGSKTKDGFWLMIIFMDIIIIFMLVFFRKKKWI